MAIKQYFSPIIQIIFIVFIFLGSGFVTNASANCSDSGGIRYDLEECSTRYLCLNSGCSAGCNRNPGACAGGCNSSTGQCKASPGGPHPVPPPPPPVSSGPFEVGNIDGVSITQFSGWVCEDGFASNYIDFYMDGPYTQGTFIGGVAATSTRTDLGGTPQCDGTTAHGFNFNPQTLQKGSALFDGKPHAIYAYGIDGNSARNSNGLLSSSPAQMAGGTPGPTSTPAPTSVNVSVKFESQPDSINGKLRPQHLTRSLTLYLYASSPFTGNPYMTATNTVTFDTSLPVTDQNFGRFTNAEFPLGNVATGDYYVLAKSVEGSLRQELSTTKFHITAGQNTTLFDTTTNSNVLTPTLAMGDVNNDNIIDINDYNILVDCYGSKSTQDSCTGHHATDTMKGLFVDLNDDNSVDGIDYNIILSNYGNSGN